MSDKEGKLSKDTMEKHFSGQPNIAKTSGEEDFPAKKFTLAARPDSKSTKGDDFKGGNSNKE